MEPKPARANFLFMDLADEGVRSEADLRGCALDELRKRLRTETEYRLPGDAVSPEATVRARVDLPATDQTAGNPIPIADLREWAEIAEPHERQLWMWDGGSALLSAHQATSLVNRVSGRKTAGYDFLAEICRRIAAGEIASSDEIANQPWPV